MPKRSLEDFGYTDAPGSGRLAHIVKKGDNLWKISKYYGVPLDRIRQLNPHIKGDLIRPNDTINLSPEYREQMIDIREEQADEERINQDNLSAIQNTKHNSNYVVIDKKNKKLNIFDKDNNLVYSTTDISTGLSGNDYNTITYVDKSGKIRNNAGNNSTPAGISIITGKGTYHGYPSFTRGRINNDGSVEDIASSLHYGNTQKKNSSNGCVRVKGDTLNDINKYVGEGTFVYTLPEKEGSRFSVKNGKLNFTADNPYGETEGNRKYWDDYNVRVDKSYSPLNIYYNGSNTNNEYNGNVLSFVNSIASNKRSLQKRFNLSSDEYNRLAQLAVGIAEQETKFGTSDRYKLKQQIPDRGLTLLKNYIEKIKHPSTKKLKEPVRSRGLTQIKFEGDNEELRKIYNELGVNRESIEKADMSAIATMARLAYMYNTEIKGRSFKGQNDISVNPYEALLYKYNGHQEQLRNRTATPDRNSYINNVKKYSLDFGFLEPRRVEI